MNSIFKRVILLLIVIFNSNLSADGGDIQITITDASGVYEGSGIPLRFTIQLSRSHFLPVTVNYTTVDGSAKSGVDYTQTNGSVTFYPFQTTKSIEVPIVDDNIYENNETLYMDISNSSNGYVVTRKRGSGIIYNDDRKPLKAKIHNRDEDEGDVNWDLKFTVELNQIAPNDITMHYRTIDGSAIAGEDYIPKSGTLTIPKGKKYGYIPITIIGDTIPESKENFQVEISSISEGTIIRDKAWGTIRNDDVLIYMDSFDIKEGNVGDHNKMRFKVYLTKKYPLDTPLTIHYQTQDGSSTPSATSSSDYISKSGDITFHKGDKVKNIFVDIVGDNTIEENEFLQMNLSGSSYIQTEHSQARILNDDGEYPTISLSKSKYSIVEGNTSSKNLDFTFKLNSPAVKGSSFHYETWNGTATTEDSDYIYTHGDMNIPEGTTRFKISVPINGDTKIEDNETFYFGFTNLNKLKYGTTNQAIATIINDDGSYPTLSFTQDSFSVIEGNSSVRDLNFTLKLNAPALENSHFDYRTSNHSAKADEDYIMVRRTTFNIPKGATSITIPIKIKGDTKIENDESFYFRIDNETDNLKIVGKQSIFGVIINDDGDYPKLDIEKPNYSTYEGNSSTHTIDIKVVLDKPALSNTSIDYYTYDKSAQDGSNSSEDSDYVGISGKLNIPKGKTSAGLKVTINGDRNIEPNELFIIALKNPKNLTTGRISSGIYILNDDVHSEEPFSCDNHMYLSSSIKRGSKVTGKMWLHRIDTSKSPFKFEVMDDYGEKKLYNALAYSTEDNYIYGLYYKELFRISKTGKVISLGEVSRLPDIFESNQAYAGASFNGYYYVTGFGVDYNKMFKIKLDENDSKRDVQEITLTKSVSIKDFSFSPDGKYLYGVADGGKLTKIDVDSGEVSFIGNPHTGYEFDSSFSDKSGRFFANDSKGHGFFEFNLQDGTKRFLSKSQRADYNDGANCLNANLIFTDYGDAPVSYGKAGHNISNGIFLGDEIDHDISYFDTVDAKGDDSDGVDDEDGLTFLDGTDINGGYFELNSTTTLKVKLSKEAYLKIWIDKDINGYFNSSSDLVYSGELTAGEHNIDIFLPPNLMKDRKTYLRVRVSSKPNMNPTGFMSDGEVEDYQIYFGDKTKPLQGVFNVERTNSGSYPINSKERNAWFTQIVGRDFDYSIVLYKKDMSQLQNLDGNITIKLELIDEDNNRTIYSRYGYISDSKVDITLPSDLNSLPATRSARFRVSYGVDGSGNIIQANCITNLESCFNAMEHIVHDDARDNFAIRPEYFHLILSDKNLTRRINISPDNTTPLRFASGYDYNLTVTASIYNGTDANPSIDYNTSLVTRTLEFLDKNISQCIDRSDKISNETFINGKNMTHLFKNQNVGRYRFSIKDENWSMVDIQSGDCDINKSYTSSDGNTISGCNIVSNPDINVSFFPYYFDVNFTIDNLPHSSHKDFIYMSEINSTFNSVAVALQGDITAMSRDGNITTNFTDGCFSKDTLLNVGVTTLSDTGIDQSIKTTKGSDINFTRVTRFNSETNVTIDRNSKFNLLPNINISKDKFKTNAKAHLDIRYNIDKNLAETINPIQITFRKIDTNSTEANSTANLLDELNPYIPKGSESLNNTVRNFYFAMVSPDKIKFPRLYFKNGDTIRTPLQIEIFCGGSVNSKYCQDTNLSNHTSIASSPRVESGWYLSIDHNATVDGGVNNLVPNSSTPNILTFFPTMPIRFTNGRNGVIMTRFTNPHGTQKYRVDIYADPQLRYYGGNPIPNVPQGVNHYFVMGTENNASTWTGVGKTGNILYIKPNRDSAHKLDW